MLRQLDPSIRGRRKISRRRLAEVYYSLVNFIIREYQSFQKILFIFEKSFVMSRIGKVMWTDYELQIVGIIKTGCSLTLNDQDIHK